MTIEDLLKKTFEEMTFFKTDESYYMCFNKAIYRFDTDNLSLNEIKFRLLTSLEIHILMENKIEFEQIGGEE